MKKEIVGNLDIPERAHGFQFLPLEDEYVGDTLVFESH